MITRLSYLDYTCSRRLTRDGFNNTAYKFTPINPNGMNFLISANMSPAVNNKRTSISNCALASCLLEA